MNHRLDQVKTQINQLGLDGIYITNITNVRYLSGFTGSAGSLLILENEEHFFTDGRYIEQSKTQVKNCTIHIVSSAHYISISSNNLLIDNMKIGIGFSLNISGNLYVEPNYNIPLSNDASGNRDGDFDLGLSYRF